MPCLTADPDSGTATDAGTPDAGPVACGGFVGAGCPSDQYCASSTRSCNTSDEPALCKPRPDGCTADYRPVCGCNGQVYGNECVAHLQGVDISNAGGCVAPSGSFACGFGFCRQGAEYCQLSGSDVVGFPDAYACLPLPTACQASPSCGCLASSGASCAASCTQSELGDLATSCPGG